MNCPDCGNKIKPLQTTCMCGWKREEKKEIIADHKCAWTNGRERCIAMGTRTMSATGSDKWYCRWHIAAMGDFRQSEQVMYDLKTKGVPEPKEVIAHYWLDRAKHMGIEATKNDTSITLSKKIKAEEDRLQKQKQINATIGE